MKLQAQLQNHNVPELLRHIADREVPLQPGGETEGAGAGAEYQEVGASPWRPERRPMGREWALGTRREV